MNDLRNVSLAEDISSTQPLTIILKDEREAVTIPRSCWKDSQSIDKEAHLPRPPSWLSHHSKSVPKSSSCKDRPYHSPTYTILMIYTIQTRRQHRPPPHALPPGHQRKIPRPPLVLQTRPPRLSLPRLQRRNPLRTFLHQTIARTIRSARSNQTSRATLASSSRKQIYDSRTRETVCLAGGTGG